MPGFRNLALVMLPALLFVLAAAAAGKKPTVCEKAEQRYQEIFGKPSADKGKDIIVVKTYKYTFCPTEVKVKTGQTLRIINVDKRTSHSFWLRDLGRPESDRLFPEDKFDFKVDMPPGKYPYLCGPHWESEDMRGTIVVTD